MNNPQNSHQQYSALSRLSPYVFSHPNWIHFIETNASYSPERVKKLLSAAQRYQQKGDLDCTCQILFICAVLQNRLNDRTASQASINQVLTLAESHHSPQEAQWAIWGKSALCTQWGRYQQAAEYLNRLEHRLNGENEWILTNIISVIRQTLQEQTDEDTSKEEGSSSFLWPNSVLGKALDYLLRWGEPPQLIEAIHNRAMSKRLRNNKLADVQTPRLISTRNWRSFWQLAKRVIKGEVRLAWIENNDSSMPAFAPTEQSNKVRPYTEPLAPLHSNAHFSTHQARGDPFMANSSPAQSKVILHTPPKEQPPKNSQPTKSLPNPNNPSVSDPVGQSQEISSPTVFSTSLDSASAPKAQDKLDTPIVTGAEIKIERSPPTSPLSPTTNGPSPNLAPQDSVKPSDDFTTPLPDPLPSSDATEPTQKATLVDDAFADSQYIQISRSERVCDPRPPVTDRLGAKQIGSTDSPVETPLPASTVQPSESSRSEHIQISRSERVYDPRPPVSAKPPRGTDRLGAKQVESTESAQTDTTDEQVQRKDTPGNEKDAFFSSETTTPISNLTEANPSLAIYCLGSFRVYQNNEAIEKWSSQKAKSIFKYLVTHREHPINREILVDLFWGEVDATSARKNLHQAIYKLRKTLQQLCPEFSHILLENGCYYLNPDLALWIDSDTFVAHYQNGQRLEREGRMGEAIAEYESAESLYQGDFLIEDLYEDWPIVQRESLKHAHLDILDRLSRYYFERDQMAICIAYCQKILSIDSCREDAQRRLMRCYLAQEQPHLALRQYHLCVEALKQELDVQPMPATVELYRQIQKSRVQSKGA